MASYTTQLRTIVQSYSLDQTGLKVDERIKIALPYIFDFDFPIWSGGQEKFETDFIRHFYMREIGFETFGLFKLKLEEKLNLIMPYYVDLYQTTQNNIDYLTDMDWTETENRGSEGSNTSQGTSQSNSNSTSLQSDLPQTALNGLDYGTNSSQDEANVNTTSNQSGTSSFNETVNRTHKGLSGDRTYSQLILEYRKTLINIEKQIFSECEDLFMLLW